MQHALGEGARYATLYADVDRCNIHTDAEVVTRMSSKAVRDDIRTFGTPTVTTPRPPCVRTARTLRVTYTRTPNFLFFNGPPVSLSGPSESIGPI